MITANASGLLSPIALSVLLIIYLIIIELGNKKIKNSLLAFVISLIAIFIIIVFQDIASKW
jgi:Mg2+/citrate symporter